METTKQTNSWFGEELDAGLGTIEEKKVTIVNNPLLAKYNMVVLSIVNKAGESISYSEAQIKLKIADGLKNEGSDPLKALL
jgi:hypothetical protein